jgi:hypothetical protein
MPIFNVDMLKSLNLLEVAARRRIGLSGVDFLEVRKLLLLHNDDEVLVDRSP